MNCFRYSIFVHLHTSYTSYSCSILPGRAAVRWTPLIKVASRTKPVPRVAGVVSREPRIGAGSFTIQWRMWTITYSRFWINKLDKSINFYSKIPVVNTMLPVIIPNNNCACKSTILQRNETKCGDLGTHISTQDMHASTHVHWHAHMHTL